MARKAKSKASPFLLAGYLFDSAGNRMTPSHSRKKGVRYRYYVSQAVLQSRKGEAGQVFRVPAPDVEAVIERFLRERCRGAQGDLRSLVEAQIARITIEAASISVELTDLAGGSASRSRQIVSLPWAKKAFRAAKGLVADPAAAEPPQELDPRAKDQVLAAIVRSRRWLDQLMAGISLADIAQQEGKGERQIRLLMPLAFVPPDMVRQLVTYGTTKTIMELARRVPLNWQ